MHLVKLFITAILLIPLTASAAFSVPWSATSTTQGWAFPLRINGVDQTLLGKNFIGTSTTATSSFPILEAGNRFFGANLSDCDTVSSALTWDISTWRFGCNSITAGGGASFGQDWTMFSKGFIAPTTTVGVVIGATSSPLTNALLSVRATSTATTTLIHASTTAGFTGKYLLFEPSTGVDGLQIYDDPNLDDADPGQLAMLLNSYRNAVLNLEIDTLNFDTFFRGKSTASTSAGVLPEYGAGGHLRFTEGTYTPNTSSFGGGLEINGGRVELLTLGTLTEASGGGLNFEAGNVSVGGTGLNGAFLSLSGGGYSGDLTNSFGGDASLTAGGIESNGGRGGNLYLTVGESSGIGGIQGNVFFRDGFTNTKVTFNGTNGSFWTFGEPISFMASSTSLFDQIIVGTTTTGTFATSTFNGNARVIGTLQVGAGTTYIHGASTSTFGGGISTTGGCFAISGSCITLANLTGLVNLTNQVTGDLPFSSLAQVSANSILGNLTGSTADATSISTSSLYSGTNGDVLARVGNAWVGVATTTLATISGALNLATQVTGDLLFSNLTQGAANTVLANPTGATADFQAVATSTLYFGTAGQVLAKVGSNWIGVATTTAGTGLTYDGTAFNNAGVLSNIAGSGITVSGATGNVTISTNDRDDIATTTDISLSQLAYYTKTSGLTTIGGVSTTTASCSGTVSCTTFSILGGAPITITGSGGGSSAFEVATTSDIAISQVAYINKATGRTTLASVATTSFAGGSGLTVTGTLGALLGGANSTLAVNDRDDIATTTDIAISQLAYFTKTGGLSTMGSVATGTVSSANTALTVTAGRSVIGGALTLTISTTTNTMFTGVAGQVLGYTNAGWVSVATTTAGTGLTYTGSAFTVNTSQNIATLSNLTGNGLVYTSGGVGTLNTANFSANTIPYVNGAGTAIVYTATSTLGLGISGGGTNATTFSVSNGLVTYDGTRLVTPGAGYTLTSSVLTATNASTTAFSSIYASSTSAFFGALNLTNISNGCLQVTSGLVSSTGSACGSAVGGTNTDKFATTTSPDLSGIYTNSALRFGLGTSTPRWALQVSTSTGPQITISDSGSDSNNHWSFRNDDGKLFIATSSVDFATSTVSGLVIDANNRTIVQKLTIANLTGILRATAGAVATSLVDLAADITGILPVANGGTGWDNLRSGYILAGNGSNRVATSSIAFLDVINQKVGFGTTTPWGLVSIASSTNWNGFLNQPIFTISTSTDAFGQLFSVFATSTTLSLGANPRTVVNDSGVRVSIGTSQSYNSINGLLDQLTLNGRLNTGDWVFTEYLPYPAQTNSATILPSPWLFGIDGSGSLDGSSSSNLSDGILKSRICLGSACSNAAASSGAGIFAGTGNAMSSLNHIYFATSTPVFEVVGRINTVQNASSTAFFVGFDNIAISGTSWETEPTVGCYFNASTTASGGNWYAVCRTSSTVETYVNTGFASTTVLTGTGGFYRFRVEADSVGASFYMASSTAPLRRVARITTTYPSTVGLHAGVWLTKRTAAGLVNIFDVSRARLWLYQPALNY